MKTHNAGSSQISSGNSAKNITGITGARREESAWPLRQYLFDDGGRQRPLKLTNSRGRVYPTLHDDLMAQLLHIAPHERVLDIGGGDAPFGRANVVTDAFPDMNAHRSGRSVQRVYDGGRVEFVQCFAEELPFPDHAFDVAYCRAVLEHVTDPTAACREMMRVAKRGFLETPSPLAEYLGGHPTHRWIVWMECLHGKPPTLVFRRKPYRRAPLAYALRGPWFCDSDFHFAWEWEYRNLICTQFAWEGEFAFRVEEDSANATRIDYDVPAQAAEAHLDAAINSLHWGDVPASIILPDAEYAVSLCPEWALAHNTHGCALWLAKRFSEACEAFRYAARLEPDVSAYTLNAALTPGRGASTSPIIVTLDILSDTGPVPDFDHCVVDHASIEESMRLLLNLPPAPIPVSSAICSAVAPSASSDFYDRIQVIGERLWKGRPSISSLPLASVPSTSLPLASILSEPSNVSSPSNSSAAEIEITTESLWQRKISIQLRGRTHPLPLTNFAGRNFPTLHDGLMTELLAIRPDERVLDLGGSATAFSRADAVREIGETSLTEVCTANLPFADNEFDVVYCRKGLAEASDPAAVCREMMRVGKRGFIETPSPLAEYLGGHPAHRWLIRVEQVAEQPPTLVFRRRPFLRPPLRYVLQGHLFSDPDFKFRWEWQYRNIVTTQFTWEGHFKFRIETGGEDYDYDDPVQAAEAYLDRAISLLRFSKIPKSTILPDIEQALRLRPDWALAHNTKGCVLWDERKYEAALACFAEAARLKPDRPEYCRNRSLDVAQPNNLPEFVALAPTREDQEDITANFAGKVYYAFVAFDERLANDLSILPGERVLDVGGGQRPLQRADVNIDFDVFDGLHRQGQEISRAKPLVCGDVQKLPFRDKAFDVVCCRMVLEHVLDPAAACHELQRVARRGFLETPNTFWECFYGHPTHRWIIEWEAQARVLVFKQKPFDQIPFRSAIVPYLYTQNDIQRAFEVTFRNLTTTQIVWDEENPFSVRVEDDPDCPYDYLMRPEDATRGSLTYSRDLLEGGLPDVAVAEAEDALRQAPNTALREAAALLRLEIAAKMGHLQKQAEMQSLLQSLKFDSEKTNVGKIEGEGHQDSDRAGSADFSCLPAITWSAPLRDPSGYADEARHFLFTLASTNANITAREHRWNNNVALLTPQRQRLLQELLNKPVSRGAIHVSHILPPLFTRDSSARANIGRTMFETDRLPPGWADACNRMDALWVPSAFNVETFAAAGVQRDKLRIVPGAIDLTPYHPGCAPLGIDGARGFNFLSVFDWTLRKGWDVLARAFVAEFSADENVALILKTHSSLGYTGQQQMDLLARYLTQTLGRDLNRIPDIIVQDTTIPDAQMPALYAAADCYVMPSRGEGWGRPAMEAMAMARPVIATGWSGQTAFLNADNSYVLDYTLEEVSEAGWQETPTYKGHRWAEPSCAHLQKLLRQAFEDRTGGKGLGEAGRASLEARFTYAPVAAIIAAELENIRP